MALITGSNNAFDGDFITEGNTNVSGSDVINLLGGDDYAEAGAGADTVDGGYGNDDIYGGTGSDKLYGFFGHDDLYGNAGSDTLWGEDGDDTLYGDSWSVSGADLADTLYGGNGADTLYGGDGADALFGGNGDDTIDLGSGSFITGDTITGGTGVDTLRVSFNLHTGFLNFVAADYLAGQPLDDGIRFVGIEQFWLRGTNSADRITGWKLDDDLMGGLGNDRLWGAAGKDEIWGGQGTDTVYGGTGNDIMYGDSTGYWDGSEADTPYGNDVIYGGLGDDSADGEEGSDTLYGESGNDNLDGGDGADTLDGGQGNDFLEGRGETLTKGDTLYGGAGDDDLYSNGLFSHDDGNVKDVLIGGAGSDEISAGVRDQAIGGDQAGTFDILTLAFDGLPAGAFGAAIGVTYNLSTQGQTLVTLANETQVDGFEALRFYGGGGSDRVTGGVFDDSLYGGKGNDTLGGHAGNDALDGNDGADRLEGGDGNDSLYDSDSFGQGASDVAFGGAGNDTFTDGYGSDTMNGDTGSDGFQMGFFLRPEDFAGDTINGGGGWDWVSYDDADAGVNIDLLNQATNSGHAVGDRFSGIEQFEGSLYDDRLLGDNLANYLDGSGSDDIINGRGGADAIKGGEGADDLTGGGGADEFILESDDAFFDTHWPHDVINDFTRGTDKLAVFESEFGVDAANFRLLNRTTEVATGAGPAFVFETDASRLWFDEDGAGLDTDGDGVIDTNEDAILVATLRGVTTLSGGDFILYDL